MNETNFHMNWTRFETEAKGNSESPIGSRGLAVFLFITIIIIILYLRGCDKRIQRFSKL